MKHYIVISYLSIFTKMKVQEYSNRLCGEEKETYAILTNEAGIQGILDCICQDKGTEDYDINVLYFESNAVRKKSGKRKKFDDFYKEYKQGVINLDSYVNQLKQEIPVRSEEEIEKNRDDDFNESLYYENRIRYFSEIRGLKLPKMNAIQVSEDVDMATANKEQLQRFIDKMEELTKDFSMENQNIGVYLDFSAGPRDFSFLSIMLTKLMQYKKYEVKNVIYSNINGNSHNEIGSIISSYEMLDVISGVNEFVNYGRVETLRKSLGIDKDISKDDAVSKLLDSMQTYSNMLSICDFSELDKTYKAIQDNMGLVENEVKGGMDNRVAIMKMQFPYIIKQMAISNPQKEFLKLFNNYIKNGMIQQAVTFYNERMPEYLFQALKALEVNDLVIESNKKSSRNRLEALLHGMEIKEGYKSYCKGYAKYASGVYILKNIDSFPNIKFPKGNKSVVIQIMKDYVIMREIRNHMNHVSEDKIMNSQNARKFYDFMANESNEDKLTFDYIQEHLDKSYKHLEELQKKIYFQDDNSISEVTHCQTKKN